MDIYAIIMLSEVEEFIYLFNDLILGESSLEDFILVVGTLVAFIAFILWCCFPVTPKESAMPVLQELNRDRTEEMAYNQLNMEL